MDDFSNRALQDFISESEEILEQMGQDLSAVEEAVLTGGSGEPDTVNRLFRGAHSLKGVAGMFGFANLAQIAHVLEDLLDQLRLGRIPLADKAYDFLVEGVGQLREAITHVAGQSEDVSEDAVLPFSTRMERFIKAGRTADGDDPLAALELGAELLGVLTEYEEHRLRENVRQGRRLFRVSVRFPLTDFDVRLNTATQAIKSVGELVTTLPSSVATDPDQLAFDLLVACEADGEALADLLADDQPAIEEVARRSPVPAQTATGDTAAEPDAASEGTPESLRSIAKTVRVDIGRLDQIMNIVGELVITKGNLIGMLGRLGGNGSELELNELQKHTNILHRKLGELQQKVMDVRMVQLRQVFDRLQRIIRRTARDLDKDVELTVLGADTELDKLIIEDLADPLMHLVRNAIDHGLEKPEQRRAAGKPERGQIRLEGYQKGNHVVIEIGDDGGGIDPERIREKAMERGLLREGQELNHDKIIQLIFEPGFSTKEAVSEISGRGVGLDVVKNNIAAIGGMIEVHSEPGSGTTFVLTLPITLAIILALLVEVGDSSYAIPLNAVVKSLAITREDIDTVEGREVIEFNGRTLPLVRLDRVFGLEREAPLNFEEANAVVVGLAEKRIGLLVDRLGGQQDVVIKPLGSVLRKVPGIAGATDLGDSRTVLVLDVAAIIDETTRGALHA